MQKTIFVVDDNDINLTVVKESLKGHYKLFTMSSVTKMFSLLEKIRPDLILLDIFMPDIDGFEALTSLKNSNEYKDIPVVFLTGTVDPSIKARGFELGIADFILKPFSESEFISKVNIILPE
jgi:CheY-like chemotaxis protein